MTRWKLFRYRLEETACRFMRAALPRLSRRALVQLANGLGSLAFHLDGRGRAVALGNLECVFGDRYTERERREIARRSYQNFALTMLGLFWSQRLTPENVREWIIPEGFEKLKEQMAATGRGAVWVTVHQGNWEYAAVVGGYVGVQGSIVAENFKNPRLTEIFKEMRERSGQTIIPQENSLLRMLKVTKRGGTTGMLIDLSLRPDQAATIVEGFDGLSMCVPLLHSVLIQRTGALVIPMETQPLPDGRCRVVVHPALDIPENASVHEISQLCWDRFEPIIRARPEEYLWAYKHFRYRPKDATRPYPAYSNESGKFEKLRKTLDAKVTG